MPYAHRFRVPFALLSAASLLACGAADPVASSTTSVASLASSTGAMTATAASSKGVFVDARNSATPAPAPRPTDAPLQTVQVPDASGFDRPMIALTLDVPAGWRPDGGVRWERNVECVGNMYGIAWSATSPNGRHAVSILPKLTWQVASAGIVEMNPCPAASMDSARAYLENAARNARPGSRVLSYRDRPDIVATRAQAMPQAQPNMRGRYEAGELLIGYALQGVEMRETLLTAVFFSELRDPMMGVSLTGSAEETIALRAPDGELDFALIERIRATARIDRDWGQQVLAAGQRLVQEVNMRQQNAIRTWHQARMSEITLNGIMERGRIRMDTIREVSASHNAGVASASATRDRMHAANIDAIQEVQPWRDPNTGSQVDLSIHYKHAWQLDDGRQFLTDDPNFNPQRDIGIGGHALEQVR